MPPAAGDDPAGDLPLSQLATSLLVDDELPRLRATGPAEALLLRGHDLRSPALAELVTRLQRFVTTPLVERLASPSAPPLHRAVAFDVPLGALRLRDRFDWVIGDLDADSAAPTPLHLIRFRYGYSPDADSPLALAQHRLAAWAAQGQFGTQRPIHLAFCDLREPQPQPRFRPLTPTDPDLLAAAEDRLSDLLCGPTQAMALPRLNPSACQSLRCGYRYLCWPSDRR